MKHSQQKQLKTFLLEKLIEEILPQVDKLHITCFTNSKVLYNAVNTTKKKNNNKTLWSLFMYGVQLPQG